MDRLRSIIVGVDFSPGSAGALRQALRLARDGPAALHVVHCIDPVAVAALQKSLAAIKPDVRETLTAEARSQWAEFSAGVEGAAGLPLHVEIDHAARCMVRQVRTHAADLLVVGAGEPPGGAGTVATACVRKVPADVLLVRQEHEAPFGRVLACVDFSDTSRLALQRAAQVAAREKAALHVLHVFAAPWHVLHYRAPTPQATPQFQQQYTQVLARRLEAFCTEVTAPLGVLATSHLVESAHHGTAIIDFARQQGVDLAVLGTRGHTNLREVLLGSTAERVLRDTPCSILAVKPAGFESPVK